MKEQKVRLVTNTGSELLTRNQVAELFSGKFHTLREPMVIILDWGDVVFIGRSAADQWFKEVERTSALGHIVKEINQSNEVKEMLEIVSRTRFSSSPIPQNIPVQKVNSAEDLLGILQ